MRRGAAAEEQPRRMMGVTWSSRCLALFLALHIASVLQSVLVSASQCDSVFKGFSDCLLKMGDKMTNYPSDLSDGQSLQRICGYWDEFHVCATSALSDCPEGATELWNKLKDESRSMDFRGSMFELCAGGNAAPRSSDARGLAVLLTALPTILTWLAF